MFETFPQFPRNVLRPNVRIVFKQTSECGLTIFAPFFQKHNSVILAFVIPLSKSLFVANNSSTLVITYENKNVLAIANRANHKAGVEVVE